MRMLKQFRSNNAYYSLDTDHETPVIVVVFVNVVVVVLVGSQNESKNTTAHD